jgi:hypothetical protein
MADKPPIGGPSPIERPPIEKSEVRAERPEAEAPPTRVEKETRPAEERAPVVTPPRVQPSSAPPIKKRTEKTATRRKIEEILAEDLEEVYISLPAHARQKFRIEGEKAAAKVEILLMHAKLALMELIKVIREWLLVLPGVNRFFVEQEAKIKADKLIVLHKEKHE